jgi:Leucine-rich repeat (LRR) protein
MPSHISPDLTHLNLSSNNLTSLSDDGFQNFTKLQELDLSNNSFEIIKENIFSNNTQLQNIIWENDNCELAGKTRKFPKLLFENNKNLESFVYSVKSRKGKLLCQNVHFPPSLFKEQASSLKHLKISNTQLNWTTLRKLFCNMTHKNCNIRGCGYAWDLVCL